VLVGLPGSGKSTLGRRVARQLRVPFVDLDEEIERREGRTVAAIFAADGEDYFRAREREVTAILRTRPSMVLAPGGGWAADPGNPALLRPPGRIIYLRVSPAVAVRRMGAGVGRRPLLAGPDPVGVLDELLRRREAAYATADVVLETDWLTQQQILAAVRRVAAGLWHP
jgi:shikimate kinase